MITVTVANQCRCCSGIPTRRRARIKGNLRTDAIDDAIGRAISGLTELVDSSGSDVPEFQSELNHAMLAAIRALQAVREDS